jgi:hypothetical protein
MKKASSADLPLETGDAGKPASGPGRSCGLWLFVIAGFALLVAVYVVAFHFANQTQIREVPVDHPGVTP